MQKWFSLRTDGVQSQLSPGDLSRVWVTHELGSRALISQTRPRLPWWDRLYLSVLQSPGTEPQRVSPRGPSHPPPWLCFVLSDTPPGLRSLGPLCPVVPVGVARTWMVAAPRQWAGGRGATGSAKIPHHVVETHRRTNASCCYGNEKIYGSLKFLYFEPKRFLGKNIPSTAARHSWEGAPGVRLRTTRVQGLRRRRAAASPEPRLLPSLAGPWQRPLEPVRGSLPFVPVAVGGVALGEGSLARGPLLAGSHGF